jgi:hypothetical protein
MVMNGVSINLGGMSITTIGIKIPVTKIKWKSMRQGQFSSAFIVYFLRQSSTPRSTHYCRLVLASNWTLDRPGSSESRTPSWKCDSTNSCFHTPFRLAITKTCLGGSRIPISPLYKPVAIR